MNQLPFQIHTTELHTLHIAQRWKREYEADFGLFPELKLTYDKLVMLGENPTAAEIDAVIGNKSWTTEYCSACHQPQAVWIEFVNPSGLSQCLCEGCIDKMATFFETLKGKSDV